QSGYFTKPDLNRAKAAGNVHGLVGRDDLEIDLHKLQAHDRRGVEQLRLWIRVLQAWVASRSVHLQMVEFEIVPRAMHVMRHRAKSKLVKANESSLRCFLVHIPSPIPIIPGDLV